MTDQSDLTPTGIDRRAALKKVAVGGAVAWAAPTVLSSRVSAQEACTLKCAPVGGVVITATVTISVCADGIPAGQQPVNGVIGSITAEAGSCGCGGTPTVELLNAPGGAVQIRPNPGNEAVDFTVDVSITCLDRLGRPVTVTCTVTFTDAGDPGNCNSRGGDVIDYSAPAVCGPPQCETAG